MHSNDVVSLRRGVRSVVALHTYNVTVVIVEEAPLLVGTDLAGENIMSIVLCKQFNTDCALEKVCISCTE